MQPTIGSAIERHAALRANAPALRSLAGQPITFAELHSCVCRAGAHLAEAGIGSEDRVGLLVPPGLEGGQLVVALASHATLVPLNPALTASEISQACRISGVKALVVPSWMDTSSRGAALQRSIPVVHAVRARDGALGLEIALAARRGSNAVRAPHEADVALLLRSSGTTGAPKLIPVTHGNLVAMSQRFDCDRWFRLTGEDRGVCLLPLYYAAGLKTSLLVPLILGQTVGFVAAGEVSDTARWMHMFAPTYLSTGPTALHAMVERLRAAARRIDSAPLRFVICGAAKLPEKLRVEAESVLGVPILEYYGLSEAGPMAANPAPPGRHKPGSVGLPWPQEMMLVDPANNRVAAGSVGEIVIRGPTVTPGYVTADNPEPAGRVDGWLATGDLGRLDEDGYLTIVGRVKELINRGGEKVLPQEIDEALLAHPAVHEAAAFGLPHPRLGESVAAAVVLKPGCAISEDELKAFLAARLASFKLPRSLWLVAELPRGPTGKILRAALSKARGELRATVVQPNGLLQMELRDLWSRLLGTPDIGIDEDFFEKGGDSLLAMEMLVAAEELVGRPYPAAELSTLTIRHMAGVFTGALAAADHQRVTQVRRGSGVPLFLCHGDYYTRGIYAHRLAALLPGDHPVYLLHGPVDGSARSIAEIAQAYLPEVLRVAAGTPVFVAGYCNGGLAAWHLTHLLRATGIDVVRLLLIETLSLNARPELRLLASALPAGPVRANGMRAAWMKRRGLVGLGTLLYRGARNMSMRPVRKEAALGPGPASAAAMDRAYLELMTLYVPPRIDVGVTCFIADGGRQLDTAARFWRRLAPAVETVSIPGTHFSAVTSERAALAAAIGQALRRAARCAAGRGADVAVPTAAA